MNKLEPLKPKKSESPSLDPLGSFYDERSDDGWTDKDLAKLTRPGHGSERNQESTSGHPKDEEK